MLRSERHEIRRRFAKPRESVVSEIDSDHAAAAFHEGAKITERLRLFQNAERVRLTGNREILLRRWQ